jgi:hypothetical protein
MAGLRRLSGIPATLASASSPSPTPISARDSYFSYSTTSSRQSSWGPVTPSSVNSPAGLGVGLSEKEGLTGSLSSPPVESVSAPKRIMEEPKIKRKPVPEVVDLDVELDGKRGSVSHAI